MTQTEGQEIFTLRCSTLENLKNETARCQVRYPRVPISTHVQTILEEVLQVDPDRIVEVEDTVTSYGFMGNNLSLIHI